MKWSLKGKNLKITPKIRNEVLKIKNTLIKNNLDIIEITFVLSYSKNFLREKKYKAEITVFIPNGILRVEAKSSNREKALMSAYQLLIKKMNVYKEKIQKNREDLSWLSPLIILPPHIRSTEVRKNPMIVKRKSWPLGKMLTEEEAIEKMELLAHDWYIFKNKKTKNINILYRRQDGNYGIVEVL